MGDAAAWDVERRPGPRWGRVISLAVGIVVLFWLGSGFLQKMGRVRHNQAGVGMGGLRMALLQYADDHSGRLPPMTDWAGFKSALLPYAKSAAAFRNFDDARVLFLPNPHLSRRSVGSVRLPTVLLYESRPSGADGSRWVAFLPEGAAPPPFGDPDFRGLRLVKEADWPRLRADNHLP